MKKTNQAFSKIYEQLNSKQQEAVDSIEGPVMVIAGPGTGKTQVLSARIANILLKTDVDPRNILALTFTESAAKNMRERLVIMIGLAAYQVHVSTFHGFCNELILQYPEYFPIARDSQALSELEKYQIFETILLRLDLDALKPLNRQLFYVKDIVRAISDLKREGVDPIEFSQVVENEYRDLSEIKSVVEKRKLQKLADKMRELAQVYVQYQADLIKLNRYDFDDMIALVSVALTQTPQLLQETQEKFQYVLVDEYQDTNSAQNKVVNRLMSYWGDEANLFVVGDPHQSIFRFQGASLENIFEFLEQYPKAKIVQLVEGYRSHQGLYNAAFYLINDQKAVAPTNWTNPIFTQVLNKLQQTPLKSEAKVEESPIDIIKAPSQLSEQLWVSQKITQLIQNGVDSEEIAVLARTNQELIELAGVLERFGIAYELSAGGSILDLEPIAQLINYLQLIYNLRQGDSTDSLFAVMSYSWVELQQLTVMKLGRLAGLNKTSLLDYLAEFQPKGKSNTGVYSLTPLDLDGPRSFVELLYSLASLDFSSTLPAWFETMLDKSGFLSWVLKQPNKVELLIALNTLFRAVKSLSASKKGAKLFDLLEFINLLTTHGLNLPAEDLNIKTGAVTLTTVHKAKGREWQEVFLTGLIDGRFGNSKQRRLLPLPEGLLQYGKLSKVEQDSEDKRLFYVGLTRAKRGLYLSYPETIINNGQSRETTPSKFIVELQTAPSGKAKPIFSLQQLSAVDQLPDLEAQLTKLIQKPSQNQIKISSATEREFFTQLVKNFSLSVSSLNSYLRDPQNFVLDVLLKVPKAKAPPMAFGTAVHTALETFYKAFVSTKTKPELAVLLHTFEQALVKEVLTEDEFKRRLAKGKTILSSYYAQSPSQTPYSLEFETFFGYAQHPTYLDDIHLTGRVDRIDWLDQTNGIVKVIDYKTGKPKSHNAIAGLSETTEYSPRELALPEPIRGVYKRQLLFYKLLADLSPAFSHQVTTGEFEFIEPNQSGKIVKQVFDLPKEEVELLKQLIKEVMAEIRSLSFLAND